LIVEHSGLLLHTSGNLNEYIDFPQGVVRMDVRKILKRDLASYVSSGLYKSEKNNLETIFKKVPYSLPGGHDRQLDIHIIPLQLNNTEKYFCVLFKGDKEIDHQNQPNQESVIIKERDRIRELEDELRISNENLQATIEELETSNEELQATNEELMASNEELQSTNEELQSVNEELYTVNSEHQAKIDILTNLNSDINNLLLHSELQVLYLDTELRIKYFTPSLSSIIDLMDADVGRSILHFSFKRHHQILIDSISKCVNEKKSAFLTLDDDKVNKVSIKPFFDETEFGGGLILSFRKD
jgi:two-component system CheB/CheR fusion protein